MKISTLRKISQEDLARYNDPIPDWVDGLISPINELLDQFTTAMRSGLSVRQNFLTTIIEVSCQNNVVTQVSTKKNSKVLGVIPVFAQTRNAEILAIDSFGYTILSNSNIQFIASFDPTPTEAVNVKLIIFFDEV